MVLIMAWYLSEDFTFFSTTEFHASFSLNASHGKPISILTAKMACIVPT
jgi:hypothetical protein